MARENTLPEIPKTNDEPAYEAKRHGWAGQKLNDGLRAALRFAFRVAFGAKLHNKQFLDQVKGKNAVIIANHLSAFDGLFMASMLPQEVAIAVMTKTYNRWKKIR